MPFLVVGDGVSVAGGFESGGRFVNEFEARVFILFVSSGDGGDLNGDGLVAEEGRVNDEEIAARDAAGTFVGDDVQGAGIAGEGVESVLGIFSSDGEGDGVGGGIVFAPGEGLGFVGPGPGEESGGGVQDDDGIGSEFVGLGDGGIAGEGVDEAFVFAEINDVRFAM